MTSDNASATLQDSDGTQMVKFRRAGVQEQRIGPIRESGVLNGRLIRVGGTQTLVPVHLKDRTKIYICSTTRALAQKLAPHLFGPLLRVYGDGDWQRDTTGDWTLQRFRIEDFRTLEDSPLSELAGKFHRVEGSGWSDLEDPFAELMQLRGYEET